MVFFRTDRRGNRVLIAIACMNICVYLIAKAFYMYLNKSRDKVWNAMTEEVSNLILSILARSVFFQRLTSVPLQERIHYLETTKDEGSARKDFRFSH